MVETASLRRHLLVNMAALRGQRRDDILFLIFLIIYLIISSSFPEKK